MSSSVDTTLLVHNILFAYMHDVHHCGTHHDFIMTRTVISAITDNDMSPVTALIVIMHKSLTDRDIIGMSDDRDMLMILSLLSDERSHRKLK